MINKMCALCSNTAKLEKSHIIPKFVFKFLKKDSFTGRMRVTAEPNKAVQDGEKVDLLCDECESIFQKVETYFSNKVFRPYKLGEFKELKYEDSKIFDFITSVNWRILYAELNVNLNSKENSFNSRQLAILQRDEEIMRNYLLGKRKDLCNIENHLFFSDKVTGMGVLEKDLLSVAKESVQGYVVSSADEKSFYVLTNLLGVYIITILKRSKKEVWKNTYIKKDGGKIKEPKIVKSDLFKEELLYAATQFEIARNKLSSTQKKQLIEKIEADPISFKKSSSYRNL